MSTITMESMLAPEGTESFLARSWGRRFRRVTGPRGRFADLMPWETLNRLLTEHSLNPARLRLVRDGETVPPPVYVRPKPFPRVKTVELTRQLREGATLVVNRIDTMHEPVGRLAGEMSSTFQEEVGVNLYAGWRRQRGFDLHWDEHDVFVLQVSGRKRWSVRGDSRPHPLNHALDRSFAPPDEVVWEGILEDGDLLYVPRGWWHVAEPLDEPSMHLTFGVYTQTARDLLLWFVDELCAGSAWARKDLPRFGSEDDRREHLERLWEDLAEQWSPDLTERYLAHHRREKRPRSSLSLPWSATAEGLPPDDRHRVRLRTWAPPELVDLADGGRVQLVANGRRWTFAGAARHVLEPLLPGEPVSIARLCREGAAADIERGTVRSLLSKLVVNGLIEIRGPAAPDVETRGQKAVAHV